MKKKLLTAVMAIALLLTGCSMEALDRKVVFTTGLQNDEVFRIEDTTCSFPR